MQKQIEMEKGTILKCLALFFSATLALPMTFRENSASRNSNENLVIIMLDGFRWDYAERQPPGQTPNFDRFKTDGVRAEYVEPIFPANSFPSWTTIVTGKYWKI